MVLHRYGCDRRDRSRSACTVHQPPSRLQKEGGQRFRLAHDGRWSGCQRVWRWPIKANLWVPASAVSKNLKVAGGRVAVLGSVQAGPGRCPCTGKVWVGSLAVELHRHTTPFAA